jgi:alpha-beta hydrolase superfamily lysophospholipase
MTKRRDGWLAGADGKRLYWQAWMPAGDPAAVVVLAHGVNEHGGRYAHVGERLADDGFAVYALDHRGHGRSDGHRSFIDRMDLVVEDMRAFVSRVRKEHAGRRPFLVGHSLGGAVAATYALRDGDSIAGLVLSGPAVATEAVSPALKAMSQILSAVAPRLPVYQIDENLISRDPGVVRAFLEDPLVNPGKLPARTLGEITRSMETLPEQVAELRTPLLLLHGTQDGLCPPEGSKMVAERAATADCTLKLYDGLYHEVFNEPERDRVLDDLASWLLERCERR